MDKRIGPFSSITVFGGATIDRSAATLKPPVPGASNPGRARTTPGGVGLNVATALARLGHPVRLVARVGADQEGEAIIAAAQAAGVDTAFVGVSPTARTATYHAAFDDRGGLIVGIADMAICDEMKPAVVAPAAMQAAEGDVWVVDANLPTDTLAFLVGEAAVGRHPIGAMAVSPAKAVRLSPLLDRLTLLFANRREAAAILGLPFDDRRSIAADLAKALIDKRTPHVVITNAGARVVVASGGEVRTFAPLRAEVRSVSGAGDALAAGTLHGLAEGRSLFEAIIPGLAAAAIALESEATVLANLTPALLGERIGAAARPAAG